VAAGGCHPTQPPRASPLPSPIPGVAAAVSADDGRHVVALQPGECRVWLVVDATLLSRPMLTPSPLPSQAWPLLCRPMKGGT
jgi:hypothetical protein